MELLDSSVWNEQVKKEHQKKTLLFATEPKIIVIRHCLKKYKHQVTVTKSVEQRRI